MKMSNKQAKQAILGLLKWVLLIIRERKATTYVRILRSYFYVCCGERGKKKREMSLFVLGIVIKLFIIFGLGQLLFSCLSCLSVPHIRECAVAFSYFLLAFLPPSPLPTTTVARLESVREAISVSVFYFSSKNYI